MTLLTTRAVRTSSASVSLHTVIRAVCRIRVRRRRIRTASMVCSTLPILSVIDLRMSVILRLLTELSRVLREKMALGREIL